ncbi:hypothetical protein RRG08_035731 [Elysia crispata]|uniref:Uncharacterized protein n=1 Tax=Elysia crispata TaxID=231223 RepID=A0AAE0YJ23_9GAST|nr:hypothetical protein RRG08_035731 [Elysia crispata]
MDAGTDGWNGPTNRSLTPSIQFLLPFRPGDFFRLNTTSSTMNTEVATNPALAYDVTDVVVGRKADSVTVTLPRVGSILKGDLFPSIEGENDGRRDLNQSLWAASPRDLNTPHGSGQQTQILFACVPAQCMR